MRRALVLIATVVVCFVCSSCSSARSVVSKMGDISPYSYGLATAKNGEERYQVLLETHRAAIKAGVNVDYTGIDTIRLEIPQKSKRIPLTLYNDFKGCVIVIKNTVKNSWLFGIEEEESPVMVSKSAIDVGDFSSIESLKNGRYLLLIEDENPWVLNRKGHDYGHQRKDILFVENGKAKNTVIKPYSNAYSSPKCSYIKVKDEPLVLKNLTIKRDPGCSKVTHVAAISGFNDVRISNMLLHTPTNSLIDDRGIRINNCTNVTLEDVRIDGTYSQPNHSGYGVNMNNIWNFKAVRLFGKANWGIFGNNNINTARLEDSQINRFDIHCYGRDISFENVEFFDLYNQYSSTFGTICYKNCTFTNFTPVLNGGSYNSFVEHEVVFKDCVFNATEDKYYLIKLSHLDESANDRHELAEKCMPNVTIKNMTVNLTGGAMEFLLFRCGTGGKELKDIGGLSKINISGLTINSDGDTTVRGVSLSNVKVQTKKLVDCQMNDVIVNQPERNFITKAIMGEAAVKANMTLKGGKVAMKNVKNMKQ